jgi:hypothetical protein
MATDAGNRQEQQQRELEEIRRSFLELGTKTGGLAVRARPVHGERHRPAAGGRPGHRGAAAAGRGPTDLGAGGGRGGLPAGGRRARLPATPPYDGHRRADRDVGRHPHRAQPQAKVVAPSACLQTAKRADEMIDLFTRNVRDNRLSLALQAYTLASQACRKEASP